MQLLQGYVEHRLNTDNAWVETQALNFHDEYNLVFKDISFDSLEEHEVTAKWIKVDKALPLPKPHMDLLAKVLFSLPSLIHGTFI